MNDYEFSECSEQAVNFYWPEKLTIGHHAFGKRMIELQLALLKCHAPLMDPSTRIRAERTTAYLKKELARC